jgi:hypothetical protein
MRYSTGNSLTEAATPCRYGSVHIFRRKIVETQSLALIGRCRGDSTRHKEGPNEEMRLVRGIAGRGAALWAHIKSPGALGSVVAIYASTQSRRTTIGKDCFTIANED